MIVVNSEQHYRIAIMTSVFCPGIIDFIYKPAIDGADDALFAVTTAAGEKLLVDYYSTCDRMFPAPNWEGAAGYVMCRWGPEEGAGISIPFKNANTIIHYARKPEPRQRDAIFNALNAQGGKASLGELSRCAHRDHIYFMCWTGELSFDFFSKLLDADTIIKLQKCYARRDIA